MRDANGESRCFGFVCFSDPSAAEKCIMTLSSKAISDGSDAKEANPKFKDVYVREAKKKSQR